VPFEILIAEDNPADVALVREALKTHNLECVLRVLTDGEKALALLDSLDSDPKTPQVDLLILDMHLPKHDGAAVLKRLRSTRNYARTPVIVMTSLVSTRIEESFAKDGTMLYFPKPSTVDELLELGSMVRNMLDQHGRSTRGIPPLSSTTGGEN
jgi:chemotaxis family two-component system response regulator Rcp1